MINMGAAVCGAIFNDKKEVLLIHRRDMDLWEMPAGALEDREAPWDGAAREVKEETGLLVKPVCLTSLDSRPHSNNDIIFTFLFEVVGGEITLTPEADQIKYFSVKNLPLRISPQQKKRVMDAYSYQGKAVLNLLTMPRSKELYEQGKI